MEDATLMCGEVVDFGQRGLRIASIFILLAGSLLGALLPILVSRKSSGRRARGQALALFICKHIGTGVITATAWMHLLSPAVEALQDECLGERLGDYDWVFAISLLTVMAMVLIELIATSFGGSGLSHGAEARTAIPLQSPLGNKSDVEAYTRESSVTQTIQNIQPEAEDQQHQELEDLSISLPGQLSAIFILEFGVVFHSVFIGLVLATTSELTILTIVFTIHQLFEGLGLGSRLATVQWPPGGPWWPYLLACTFALASPLAIAIGIAAKPSNAETQLLVTGIFNSVGAGILMYTGLVELLAKEFIFNPEMRRAPVQVRIAAFSCVAFGVSIMAVLAVWA